jgi:hypothetical protein
MLMKYVIIGTVRPNATQEIVLRALKAYSTWKPHADLKVQSMMSAVDHDRVFMVAETENASALYEAALRFAACLKFEVVPVQDSQVALPTALKVLGQPTA